MTPYLRFEKPLERNYNADEKVNWYYSAIRRYEEYKMLEGTIVVNKDTDDECLFVPESSYGYFQVTALSRDDFEERGYDASKLTDNEMKRIADKMGDNYVSEMFWEDVDFWATEYNLPYKFVEETE